MKIAILANNATGYFKFFSSLADKFEEQGAEVVWIVDSFYSKEYCDLNKKNYNIYVFEEYFKKHYDDEIKVNDILNYQSLFNYNIGLNPEYDRSFYNQVLKNKPKDYHNKLINSLIKFYEYIYEKEEVSLTVYENISGAFSYFAALVSQKNGLSYVGLTSSRVPGRLALVENLVSESCNYEKILNEIESGRITASPEQEMLVNEYLEDFLNQVPDYMKLNGLDKVNPFRRYVDVDSLKLLKLVTKYSLREQFFAFQIGNPIRVSSHQFSRRCKRALKSRFISRYHANIDEKESYFLYPIHYHPEASTSYQSPFYINELETIRNIALSLPFGTKLVVKDHVSSFGFPSLSFYKSVSEIPNVLLASHLENTKHLIKKSKGVITLTSTVGYEALILNKPVFLLGNVFYEHHKNVIKVNWNNLFINLNRSIDTENDDYNKKFLLSYFIGTYPIFLNYRSTGKVLNDTTLKLSQVLLDNFGTECK